MKRFHHRTRFHAALKVLLPALAVSLAPIVSETLLAAGPGDTFEIDLQELEKLKASPQKLPVPRQTDGGKASAPAVGTTIYTVKPGDFPLKILVNEFGLSRRDAELLIPELLRINGLTGSTRLQIGSRLTIPAVRHQKVSSPRPAVAVKQAPVSAPAIGTAIPATPAETSSATEAPLPDIKPVLTIKTISAGMPDLVIDQLLSALAVPWQKDRVISGAAGAGTPESFSIKVERYLELDGKRYVLTLSGNNPYEYTMLRLLETSGYTIIRLDGKAAFQKLATDILTRLGFPFSSGSHRFVPQDATTDPRIIDGLLVALRTPGESVFICDTPLDAISAAALATASVEPVKDAPGAAAQ